MFVEELDAPDALEKLRSEWDALLARAPAAGLFDTWEWRAVWWRHYGAGRRPRVLAVRDDTRGLVGLWPLFEEDVATGLPVVVRRWRQVGNGVTGADYVDVIAAAGREDEVRSTLLAHLALRRGAWDRLELDDFART